LKESFCVYIHVLVHNQALLQEEVSLKFPNWEEVSSGHGLLIFKTLREYSLEELSECELTFALGFGRSLLTSYATDLDSHLKKYLDQFKTSITHYWDLCGDDITMGDRKTRGPVLDVFKENDQYHIGVRFQLRGDFAPFKGSGPLPKSTKVDDDQYQVLAESFKHFRPLVAHDEIFLNIKGSAGGRACYLLEKGFRVIGLGLDDIVPQVKQHLDEDYLHIFKDLSEINASTFVGLPPIDWIVAQVRDDETSSLRKMIKILDKHFESRGLLLTIEVTSLKNAMNFIELIKAEDFETLRTGQLPSHKREFSLLAVKKS